MIKKEDAHHHDEKSIILMDEEMKDNVDKIFRMVYTFSKFQIENKDLLIKGRASFKGRILEDPFNIASTNEQELKGKGQEMDIVEHKKLLQDGLLLLQLHPCYIIKLLKSGFLSYEQQKLVIKQLFTSNKRSNQ